MSPFRTLTPTGWAMVALAALAAFAIGFIAP
jgi:hypothetical protein